MDIQYYNVRLLWLALFIFMMAGDSPPVAFEFVGPFVFVGAWIVDAFIHHIKTKKVV